MDYIVTEEGSNIVFAVIRENKNELTATKVSTAVKEEFGYAYASIDDAKGGINGGKTFVLDCETEYGEKELRTVELSLTAIY